MPTRAPSKADFVRIDGRFWRMLVPRWQRQPLSGNGAATKGGRWNRPRQATLYTSTDHSTAIAEYHQLVVRPGMLATYDIASAAIADLTDRATLVTLTVEPAELLNDWQTIVAIEKREPPTWLLADRLLASGADGALVPSAQHAGGVNLVLWRWSADGRAGAHVRLLDPFGDLAAPHP